MKASAELILNGRWLADFAACTVTPDRLARRGLYHSYIKRLSYGSASRVYTQPRCGRVGHWLARKGFLRSNATRATTASRNTRQPIAK